MRGFVFKWKYNVPLKLFGLFAVRVAHKVCSLKVFIWWNVPTVAYRLNFLQCSYICWKRENSDGYGFHWLILGPFFVLIPKITIIFEIICYFLLSFIHLNKIKPNSYEFSKPFITNSNAGPLLTKETPSYYTPATMLGGYNGIILAIRLCRSIRPCMNSRFHSEVHTVVGGLFPCYAQMITRMNECVAHNDIWP